ncbi:exo-beta-1,3-glucanase, partial [Bombardia bombarda]
ARAVGEFVSNPADARWDNSNINDGIGNGQDVYTMHWGAGTAGEGWPTRSQWVSFENMFNNNKNLMFSSCSQFGQPNDSGPEIGAIWDSIQQVASETAVDHRFILAVILQESGGCARAPTSNFGVRNPGLMQCHNGDGTCNSDITGQVQNPCPTGVITQMIREGTAGTNSGDGLANCVNQAGWSTDADFYRAARIYNSGSVASSTRLECGIATHCYAADIANRLTGWVNAPHNCPCDTNFASCGC